MTDWPIPSFVRALCRFLGLKGFYRKFIKGYAAIAHPVNQLLHMGFFQWSPSAQQAFDSLKRAMTEALVLALLAFALPFALETDALGATMGVVLMQSNHPIAFFSKNFCPR